MTPNEVLRSEWLDGWRAGGKMSEALFCRHKNRRAMTYPVVTNVWVTTLGVEEARSLDKDSHYDAADWMRREPAQFESIGF